MFKVGSAGFARWLDESVRPRLSAADSEWEGHRTGLRRVPTEWFLTGLVVDKSAGNEFYVYAYSYPLFCPSSDRLILNFSRRVLRPGASTFPLPTTDSAQEVADAVATVWENDGAPRYLETMGSTDGLLEYIRMYREEAFVGEDEAAALLSLHAAGCHLLREDPDAAEVELDRCVNTPGARQAADVELARELLELVRANGDALDRLTRVRDESLRKQVRAL